MYGRGGFQRGQFQKPENALKRADELIAIDKKEDALLMLNEGLRAFRRNWTQTTEDLVIRHMELCVDLRNVRLAKDALIQYRAICQQANITSLESVVKKFRAEAEKRAAQAKKEADDSKMQKLDDLDEDQNPDEILLGSVQTDVRKDTERDLHAWFRYLWESYKLIMDVLRNNQRLEDVYHETAKLALNFCADSERHMEFKRLCDMLRFHYQNLLKPPPNQVGPNFVSVSNPETVQKLLDTRFEQLRKGTALGLWREAFNTADEIHLLMSKCKPRPFMLAQYYEALQQIFWKSENYLFHAFAMLKYYLLCKQNRRNFPKAEEQQLASQLLLGCLCVPFESENPRVLENDTNLQEKHKRLARLLGSGGVPTRASIKAEISVRRLSENAFPIAKELYDMCEGGVTPLSLSEAARPVIEEISTTNEGKLADYCESLKRTVFLSMLTKLSTVYSTMRMDSFKKMADILPWNDVEKCMTAASKGGIVHLRINYADRTIVFGAEDFTVSEMRQSLMSVANSVVSVERGLFAKERSAESDEARKNIFEDMEERFNDEVSEIIHRRHVIEDRKQIHEKKRAEEDATEKERLKEEQQKEDEKEKDRLKEEKARRDAERAERREKERELEKNKKALDDIKEKAGKAASTLKVGGKTLKELEETDDIGKLDLSALEKAQEAHLTKEREKIVRARKAEQKRVDHFARAIQGESNKLIGAWKEEKIKQCDAAITELKADKMGDLVKTHESKVAGRTNLAGFVAHKAKWHKEEMKDRIVAHDVALEKDEKVRQARKEKAMRDKVDRARDKLNKHYEDEEKKEKLAREKSQREEQRKLDDEKKEADAEELKRVEERKRIKDAEMAERRKADRDRSPSDDSRDGRRRDDRDDRRRDDSDDDNFRRRRDDTPPRRRDDRDDDRRDPPRRDDRDDDEGANFRNRAPAPAPRRDDRDNFRSGGGDRDGPRRGGRDDDRRPERDGSPDFASLRNRPAPVRREEPDRRPAPRGGGSDERFGDLRKSGNDGPRRGGGDDGRFEPPKRGDFGTRRDDKPGGGGDDSRFKFGGGARSGDADKRPVPAWKKSAPSSGGGGGADGGSWRK